MPKAFVVLLACCIADAQTHKNAAEQLGYDANTKLLIVHADDLAVAHSVDRASFDALDSRAVTAASIMVPCPWLTEVAAYAKEHPDADLGLHLTLTSEWKNYRWDPVARQALPGLLAPDGNLWGGAASATQQGAPAEVETEIRAQIERAMKVGIRPTHVDSHMGVLFSPVYFPVYVKVAREYGIPFFMVRTPDAPTAFTNVLKETDILADSYVMAGEKANAASWRDFYASAIKSLKPGLTVMIVHLGHDDAELQAITEGHPAYGSAWRQRDYDLVMSPEFRKLLRDNQVKPIGWKEILAWQKH
jgi:predicted glycoside hydrolase/deacetylase ChbG (UPF0249 family)